MADTYAKELYLKQAYRLNDKIKDIEERLSDLRALLFGINSLDYSKIRVQGGNNQDAPFTDKVIKAIDYEIELKDKKARLELLKVEISQAIDAVEDVNCSLVLSKKYVLMKTWEQIAEDMNYSVSQVQRIHKKALEIFVIPKT